MSLDPRILEMRINITYLARELDRRGAFVELLDWDHQALRVRLAGREEILCDIDSSRTPYYVAVLAGNKELAKENLRRAGISVPEGRCFRYDDRFEALEYAPALGYPVVVKPCTGTQGEQVHVGLQDVAEVMDAIEELREYCGDEPFLVERQIEGREYRILILCDGHFAVLHRDPAHVIGNGKDAIRALAEAESARRLAPPPGCLCPIALDAEAERFLKKQGLSLSSVPAAGEKVYLRGNSNLKTGGVCTDYTDRVHASAVEIAKRALAAFPGMPYAGLDFISQDITAPQTPERCSIIEVNPLPAIGPHCAPARGAPQPVAAWLANLIFPESVNG